MQNGKVIQSGAVCGRFQVFHNDHLKYVLEAKKCCRHLYVGVTSSDPFMAPLEKSDLNRGKISTLLCDVWCRIKCLLCAN